MSDTKPGFSGRTDAALSDIFGQEFWDERYRSRPALWSGAPNPHLCEQVANLTPGRALDVGSGEGADALWLAERGWRVTAMDISTVALQRGAARAAVVGASVARRIEWRHQDVLTWEPEVASYELVSAQYLHPRKELRESLFGRLAASVVAGGTLLIVGHHISDLQTTAGRWPMPEVFFAASDVAACLDPTAWDIVVVAAPERATTDPQGCPVTVHDAVLRARRRA
jgi:SAM-dependent methyltransferase